MSFRVLKYIIYKLLNNSYSYIFLKENVPLVLFKNKNVQITHELAIDLKHSTTHLGDRLFFIPLVRHLINQGVKVNVLGDQLFSQLYSSIVGDELPNEPVGDSSPVLIIKPSLLDKRKIYSNPIVIDFTDTRTKNLIAYQLVDSISLLFGINSELKKINCEEVDKSISAILDGILDATSKYIIFNNYIDSGRFRKLFLDSKKLNNQCIILKRLGYKIIHVGSAKDKKLDNQLYEFVDIDIRGLISVVELTDLIASREVIGVVTFDNFVMHIAHIFSKKTWVLFRGRFRKSQYFHHIKFVNNTFLLDKKTITYL